MDNKTTAAVVVDYDYYRSSPAVQEWVKARDGQALFVALVSSPDAEHPEDYLDADNEIEWDVVIANPKGYTDQVFKWKAMDALKAYSNIHPVIALDLFNEETYRTRGNVLMVVTPND